MNVYQWWNDTDSGKRSRKKLSTATRVRVGVSAVQIPTGAIDYDSRNAQTYSGALPPSYSMGYFLGVKRPERKPLTFV